MTPVPMDSESFLSVMGYMVVESKDQHVDKEHKAFVIEICDLNWFMPYMVEV